MSDALRHAARLASLAPPAPRAPRSLTRDRELAARAAPVLLGLLFAALIIGPAPLASHAAVKSALTESGNAFNRLVIFAMLVPALVTTMLFFERWLSIVRRNWIVVLITLWCGLSYLWASHPDLTIRRFIAAVLIYLTLSGLAAAAKDLRSIVQALAAGLALVSLLSVFAILFLPGVSHSDIGEMGIFDNKNGAGTMAMLAILVLGTAFFLTPSLLWRIVILGCLALSAFFLLATKSKTTMGVTAIVAMMGPVLYLVFAGRWPIRLAAILAAVTGLAGFLTIGAALGMNTVNVRLFLFDDLTFTGRTDIWEALVYEIARRPWLGWGFGSFWDTGALVNPITSAPPDAFFLDAQLINTAHNGYIDSWLQTGFVGLAMVVLAILRCMWLLSKAAASSEGFERVAFTGALCVVISLVFNNFLESYLFRTGDNLGYLFILFMLMGEAAALRRRRPLPRPLPPPLSKPAAA